MKILLLILLVLTISSCGKKDDPKVISVRNTSDSYRGYDIYGASQKCKIPPKGQICTQETSQRIDSNRNFADICEDKGSKAYNCNCEKRFLCSSKKDVLEDGYNMKGRKVRDIPHKNLVRCPDGGHYFPGGSARAQENYQSKCEAAGHKAFLVGCQFKQYLCSKKI